MPRNKVQIEFSDFNEAAEFKREMEERFGIEKVSKYQIASGTGKHGGRVYVESTEDKENNNMNKLDERRRAQKIPNNLAGRIVGIIENHGFSLQRSDAVNGHDLLAFEIMPGTVVEVNVFFEPSPYRHGYYWMECDATDDPICWDGIDEEEFEKDLDDLASLFA